jgi:hypothetical protein
VGDRGPTLPDVVGPERPRAAPWLLSKSFSPAELVATDDSPGGDERQRDGDHDRQEALRFGEPGFASSGALGAAQERERDGEAGGVEGPNQREARGGGVAHG